MTTHTDSYWLGTLAMTVALAAKRDKPQNLLRSTIGEFLQDRPQGCPVAAMIREALEQKAAA